MCTTFLLNKIYPPMKFHIDISKAFLEICSTQMKNLVWKIKKGNNSKIMKGRVITLMHWTPPEWDLSIYEVSCWYLKGFCSYTLDKNLVWKITKGNNWKIMHARLSLLCAALLLNEVYPPMKFQGVTSNTFWDMLHSGEKFSMKNNKGQ